MKKARVTRRMLESYVRGLLMEKSVPTRAAITYQASPSQTQRVLASVFSGGTDFGQAFEEICMEMLRVNGFTNVSDLNPDVTYSVEDGDGAENKSSDQNAELADTIIFDNAYTGTPVPGEVTIDQLPNVILLSAKANKGPKAFIGEVSKLRSKLKKLVKNRVLDKTELSKKTEQLNVRLGTINIALNPRLSLQQEAAIYDVLISMPNVPNLGVVGINKQAIQALEQAKEDVNGSRFQTQFLPTVLRGIAANKSMGKLGQIINMTSDSDSANTVFAVQSSTSFTKADAKTAKNMFVNPLASTKKKNSYTNNLKLVQRSEKGGAVISTGTVTDQLNATQREPLYKALKNNKFNILMETYSTNIANQFADAFQDSINNYNATVIKYKKDRGTFYQELNEYTTDETTNQSQFEAYINQLLLNNVPQAVIDAAEKLKDMSSYKKIEEGEPTWKLKSVKKLAKGRKNKQVVTQEEFDAAKKAYNKAISDAKEAEANTVLQAAGFSIDDYNTENARGKWMTNTEFKNSTSGYADTVSEIIKATVADKDYLGYDSDTQEITITNLSEIKSDVKGIILDQFGAFDSPGYNSFFINLSAYSVMKGNNRTGYFATATSQNAIVNPDEFITIGEQGFLSSHLTPRTVSQLLDENVKTDVYLLDPNQNPIYSPKDSSSNYYNFHNSFVSQVPNTQLYFQVKLDLGNYAINDEKVKADIVRKYNEVVLKNNPIKIKAFKTEALETEERMNWGKLSALTFVSALVDATLRTVEYTGSGSYPPQRKEPEFEIGTDEEGREGYEYPRPISQNEMFQLKEDMGVKILELQIALGTYVSTEAAQTLMDFMTSIRSRNETLGLDDVSVMTREEFLVVNLLSAIGAEQLRPNLPSTPPIQKENLSRDIKYTVGQLYEIIISFCDHMIKLIDQDKRDEVLGVLEKLSEHIPKLKSALEKEEPGFLSRLGSRFMQGVEDISGRVGQAVDDLGQALTPAQLAEQKLYEDIIVDLMEASAENKRAAQQTKKIKLTKRQLQELVNRQLK